MHRSTRRAGFTLIELLVVIAIIGVLAGLVTASVNIGLQSADKKNCKNQMNEIAVVIESYLADYGDYPPSDLEFDYGVIGNGVNSGIESLIACLCTKNKGGPYLEVEEEFLGNKDGDSLSDVEALVAINWVWDSPQLWELLDPWGNPFIYIHNRDYDRSFTVTSTGEGTSARGARSPKTNTYYAPTGYQMWSCGPNGINENGEGDDITSWQK